LGFGLATSRSASWLASQPQPNPQATLITFSFPPLQNAEGRGGKEKVICLSLGNPGSLGKGLTYPLGKEVVMETIEVKVVRTGAVKYRFFVVDGIEFDNLEDALYQKYSSQGELYERVFGISKKVAEIVGWHPDDTDFSTGCEGWKKFLEYKGEIRTIEIKQVPVKELIFMEEESEGK